MLQTHACYLSYSYIGVFSKPANTAAGTQKPEAISCVLNIKLSYS